MSEVLNRIMVIGCCGAGKSTLSQQLHTLTGLPLIHLDQYYWKPGWVESEPSVWNAQVRELAMQEQWIIDGNYGGTLEIRLARADMVIFLDRSRWLCTYRILKRTFFSFGKKRTDMAIACEERFDWEFLVYTFTFWNRKRPALLAKLAAWKHKTSVVRLRNDQEMNQFLHQSFS